MWKIKCGMFFQLLIPFICFSCIFFDQADCLPAALRTVALLDGLSVVGKCCAFVYRYFHSLTFCVIILRFLFVLFLIFIFHFSKLSTSLFILNVQQLLTSIVKKCWTANFFAEFSEYISCQFFYFHASEMEAKLLVLLYLFYVCVIFINCFV